MHTVWLEVWIFQLTGTVSTPMESNYSALQWQRTLLTGLSNAWAVMVILATMSWNVYGGMQNFWKLEAAPMKATIRTWFEILGKVANWIK
jgi:hypothetical protein